MRAKLIPKPPFEWAAPVGFAFNSKSQLNTKGMEKNDDLKNLQSITIHTKFKVVEQKKMDDGTPALIEIVGHSSCDCWGLTNSEQGLQFGKQCSE